MKTFYRYPHTPHLEWLGIGTTRGDKVLTPQEKVDFISSEVTLEEKVDGANLGISIGGDGLQFQNRGNYLSKPFLNQFSRLQGWHNLHESGLKSLLKPNLIIFGEWCAAKHSLVYESLPDYFLCFDIYDRKEKMFWNISRRNEFAQLAGLNVVPNIGNGLYTIEQLIAILETTNSAFGTGPIEGLYIRKEIGSYCINRAKLVQPEFIQGISEHWSRRDIVWNNIKWDKS